MIQCLSFYDWLISLNIMSARVICVVTNGKIFLCLNNILLCVCVCVCVCARACACTHMCRHVPDFPVPIFHSSFQGR